jgi:outer membrane lipoprotein carrier protein
VIAIIKSGLILVLLLFVESGIAESPAQELTVTLNELRHFSADFTQVTTDANGDEIQRSTGHLWITKPRKFRSHNNPPMEQVLVSNGELLWYYDPDLEQVTIQKLELLSKNQPALLLAEKVENISDHFLVDYYEDESAKHYVLSPIEKDGSVTSLVLETIQGTVSSIRVYDALKQMTTIEFSAARKNVPIDPAIYHFDIPEGVDVVKEF